MSILPFWGENVLFKGFPGLSGVFTPQKMQFSRSLAKTDLILDFILDNFAFELFADLCLADYMCSTNIAQSITFHVKVMPWFVSDVMQRDFTWAIHTLVNSQSQVFNTLGRRWRKYVDDGTWEVKTELFWTLPHDFSLLKTTDPTLYEDLSKAELIIIKGDLNYMKLVDVLQWDPSTSFGEALRRFHPSPLVSLRSIKSDVVVGLPAGLAEEYDAKRPAWRLRGDYAVVQFCK